MPLSVPHVVTKIISILPTKYKPFKSSWRRVPKGNLTIATLTTDLLQEERDLAKQGHKGSKQKEQESQSLALQAQSSRNEKDSSQRGSSKRNRDTSQTTRYNYSHNRQHSGATTAAETQAINRVDTAGRQITTKTNAELNSDTRERKRGWQK